MEEDQGGGEEWVLEELFPQKEEEVIQVGNIKKERSNRWKLSKEAEVNVESGASESVISEKLLLQSRSSRRQKVEQESQMRLRTEA